MGIIQRAADIMAANLNDLVDHFEEPERMLRQALREFDALLATMSLAVARSIAAEKLLAKTRDEHVAAADAWQRRAVSALSDEDDSLARRAIARQLDHARLATSAGEQLDTTRATNDTLRIELDALRARQAAARTRLALVSARETAADAQRQVLATSAAPNGQSRALARFDRFCQQVELAEAEARALVELQTDGETTLAFEFERRATQGAIEAELARLKGEQTASTS